MLRIRTRLGVLAGLVVFWAAPLEAASAPALGWFPGNWQLFVDDYAVSSKAGVTRVLHPFEKYEGNPVLKVDQPWEHDVVNCTTVLPNESGDGYRMWYYCWTSKEDPDHGHALYATSPDGIHWEKPKLGLREWKVNGSKENNIVEAGGSILYTPDDPEPSRRYKAINTGSYKFSASADGLHWEPLSKEKIFSAGDTGHVIWDPLTRKYRGYAKVNAVVSGMRRRAVGYSEGTTFESWDPLRLVMAPDDLDDRWCIPGSVQRTHFYNCPIIVYQNMYLGLMMIYRANDDEGYFHGRILVELVTSRDGVHWRRGEGDRPALLEGGPSRTWDHGMVTASSLVQVGDKLRMYYSGYNGDHDHLPFFSAVGIAHLRKDGFASFDAEDMPGEVVTKRLSGASGKLLVNCSAVNGLVQVEVLDANMRVVPGYGRKDTNPIRGDGVEQVATWREHTELPVTKEPLRLRFWVRNASLYSFHAGDAARVMEDEPGPTLGALYTFEGDGGRRATDRLTQDGAQELKFLGTSKVDPDEKNAGFGKRSLMVSSPWRPLNALQIVGSANLGRRFTLAVSARITEQKPARLFSSYTGNKPVGLSELVFDCDPRGKALAGLRLICKGIPVESKPLEFGDGKYHHMAVTYDDGHVRFYLDGADAGEAWLPGEAPVKMARDLLIGEDAEMGSDEQFIGNMDDVLVLGRVLTPEEISEVAKKGADAVLAKER